MKIFQKAKLQNSLQEKTVVEKKYYYFYTMIVFPNAKINIGLNILRKRVDGYHAIDSIFYPVKGLYDGLEIIKSDFFEFTTSGISIPDSNGGNLCLKAYHLLQKDFNLPPVKIHLHKVIPIGAGLGGGSADGAFTLNLLNDLFSLKLNNTERENYALELGSDCPFFIKNLPTHASGMGEILNPVKKDLNGYKIVLVNPNIHIGTKEAYAGIVPHENSESTTQCFENSLDLWKSSLTNDFEKSIFPNYPQLEQLKKLFYDNGADYASMSGSGSTVYGIFKLLPNLIFLPKEYFIWHGNL